MESHNQQGDQKKNATKKNKKKKMRKTSNSEKVKEKYLINRNKSQSQWASDLPWTDATVDDPFSIICGSSHGGFLSLEEIDEDVYNLEQNDSVPAEKTGSLSKKRKHTAEKNDEGSDSVLALKGDSKQGSILKSGKKKNNKKKKKRKKAITDKNEILNLSERSQDAVNAQMSVLKLPDDVSAEDCEDELSIDAQEISAWKELRLHPLLEKAISALHFKEPTAIQKLCIPAAAHQGKDVIGAAETGSGKTLAFGLPILQRLLEEQEKAARKEGFSINEGETVIGEKKGNPLRALIVTPTRELALQVCDHLRAAAKFTNVRVVPIVGGIAPQKQERLLKQRPHVIVGTPGRLWELMAGGENHLVELQSLSFFVLDEADRMIEKGHFHELRSIIDMLPQASDNSLESLLTNSAPSENASRDQEMKQSYKRKKRQTFVFSATIALTSDFRKKLLKGSSHKMKTGTMDGRDSLATLSERAGVRENAAIIDLTTTSIVAHKLEESIIECREEDKDAYLYYILKVHGCGRTIVFCTSIAALRRISAILRLLQVTAWPLHAQMQQRARLKAMDRFKENENCVLVATDVAARGLDIPGVRTVIHYQLPHSAEVYVHRSGRTARADTDGCSIALISPSERSKYIALCRSFSKDGLPQFPVKRSYMSEVEKHLTIARQIDRILRKHSQRRAENNWLARNAEALEMDIDANDSDDEKSRICKSNKADLSRAKQLQKELDRLVSLPLQPKSFSHRFVAGAGMSMLLQQQLQELTSNKAASDHKRLAANKKQKLLVIGQEATEPLMALRNSKNVP